MNKPKAEADAWMRQRHKELVDTVLKLHKDTGLLHGDLKDGKSRLAYLRWFYWELMCRR